MSLLDGNELTATALRKLKVAQLRELCEQYQLETQGIKAVLVDRLVAYGESNTTTPVTTGESQLQSAPETVDAAASSSLKNTPSQSETNENTTTNSADVMPAPSSTGAMTEAERLALRAARFGTQVPTPSLSAKSEKGKGKKKNKGSTPGQNAGSAQVSGETDGSQKKKRGRIVRDESLKVRNGVDVSIIE